MREKKITFASKISKIMKTYEDIMESFSVKLIDALSSVWGWIIAAVAFICNFFAGYGLMATSVIVAIVLDAIWGVTVSVKQGRYACSELMRDTFTKVSSYGTAIIISIFVEKVIPVETTLCSSIVSAVICLTELWSISGNIVIINPNIVFFKLLKPYLRGEIARKLGIPEDKVDEALSKN